MNNFREALRGLENALPRLHNYVPQQAKYFLYPLLKPYYRLFLPNRLHVLFWPTFRCNYKCSYCPYRAQEDYLLLFPRDKERKVTDWLKVFDRLAPAVFFIAGGEPFLYEGMIELINAMPSKHAFLGIVTNCSHDINVYKQIKRKICFNVSLHRQYISAESFLGRVQSLSEFFPVNAFIVATPENIPHIETVKKLFFEHNIFLHVDPYLEPNFEYSQSERDILNKYISGERHSRRISKINNFEKRLCSAGRNYINILPDGQVYTCAGGMGYTLSKSRKGMIGDRPVKQFNMGNIFDENFAINNLDMECALPCFAFCDHDYCIIKPCTQPGNN